MRAYLVWFLLSTVIVSAHTAHAAEPAPAPEPDAMQGEKHAPAAQDFHAYGAPGWTSDRTLGDAFVASIMAGYRIRFVEVGASVTGGVSTRDGQSGYASGGLSLSGVLQNENGVRATLGVLFGFDDYEKIAGPDADCGGRFMSMTCEGGASATLPYAEMRAAGSYVFPVHRRTHLELGVAFLIGSDLSSKRASYDKLDGSTGTLELGSPRVGLLATIGLTFDTTKHESITTAKW